MRGYSNRTSLYNQLNHNPIVMHESIIEGSAFADPVSAQKTAQGGNVEVKPKENNHKGAKETQQFPFGVLKPTPFTVDKSSIYARTYYYMEKQMFQLQYMPRLSLPFWVRDFIDAFYEINDD
jgi:hypothetical protein